MRIENINLMYLCPKTAWLEYTERIIESNDWATYLLVSCFMLLAVAKYSYPRRFEEFIILPLSDKYLTVRGKDDAVYHPFNIMLFTINLISATVFIFLLFRAYNPSLIEQNNWLLVQIFTGYTTFVLIKFSIEKIIANIFSIDAIIDLYLYQKLSHRNFLGLLVFLGNLFFLYIIKTNEITILIFTISILVFNTIALFYSYKKNRKLIATNFFHFILYLCALEISPYIILYKLFF